MNNRGVRISFQLKDTTLLKPSLKSMAVKAVSAGLLFLLGVTLARVLGPANLGIYAYTIAWVQILAVVVQCGFPAALMRLLAMAEPRNQIAQKQEILRSALLAIGLAFVGVFAIASVWILISGPPQGHFALFFAGLLLVPILAWSASLSGALRGLGLLVSAQTPDQILRPAFYLIALVGFLIAGASVTATSAILIQAASGVISVLIALWIAQRALGVIGNSTKVRPIHWAKKGAPFLLLAGVLVINYQVGIIILGHLVPPDIIGQYRVAVQFADGMNMLLFAISAAIGPRIARLQSMGDWDSLQKLLIGAHRLGFAAMLIPCLILALWGSSILTMVFGTAYAPASMALSILAIGKLAYGLVGFSGLALSMMGRPRRAAAYSMAALIVNVCLALLLTPKYGGVGAALAVAISEVAVNGAVALHISHMIKRNISAFGNARKELHS